MRRLSVVLAFGLALLTTSAVAAPETFMPGPFMVFFDSGKSDITKSATAILDNAASVYKSTDSAPVWVVAHTDSSGSRRSNLALSQRRAAAVRDYLTARGIPTARITTSVAGEKDLLLDTADGESEPQNRRVEITFGPLSESW